MDDKKRKREEDEDVPPRITYDFKGRTFDRLFKETSLEQTKQVVRTKLNLAPNARIKLEQLRDGKVIDLEDDDDFDAFRALAHAALSLEVRVTIIGGSIQPINTPGNKARKKRLKQNQSISTPGGQRPPLDLSVDSSANPVPAVEIPTTAPAPASAPPSTSALLGPPITQPSIENPTTANTSTTLSVNPTKRKSSALAVANAEAETEAEVPERGAATFKVAKPGPEPRTKKRKTNTGAAKSVEAGIEAETAAKFIFMEPVSKGPTNAKGELATPLATKEAEEVEKETAKEKEKEKEVIPPVPPAEEPTTTTTAKGKLEAKLKSNAKAGASTVEVAVEIPIRAKSTGSAAKPAVALTAQLKKAQKAAAAALDAKAAAATEPLPETKKVKRRTKAQMAAEAKASAEPTAAAEAATAVEPEPAPEAPTRPKARVSKTRASDEPVAVKEPEMAVAEGKGKAKIKVTKNKKDLATDDVSEAEDTDAEKQDKEKSQPKRLRSSKKKTIEVIESDDASPTVVDAGGAATYMQPAVNGKATENHVAMEVDEPVPANQFTTKNTKANRVRAKTPRESVSKAEIDALFNRIISRSSIGPSSGTTTAPVEVAPAVATAAHTEPGKSLKTTAHAKTKKRQTKTSQVKELRVSEVESVLASDAGLTYPTTSPPPPELTTTAIHSHTAPPAIEKTKDRAKRGRVPCPICSRFPFHLRWECPVIKAGPESIVKRLQELKAVNGEARLIEELEQILRKGKAMKGEQLKTGTTGPPVSPAAKASPPTKALSTASQSSPSVNGLAPARRLTIPSGSKMSEVTVEAQGEGSSNDSSEVDDESDEDTESEKGAESKNNPAAKPKVAASADADLEAIVRGPASQSKSVLDDIPSDSESEDEEDSDGDDEEEEEVEERQSRDKSQRKRISYPSLTTGSRNESEVESDENEQAQSAVEPLDKNGTQEEAAGLTGSAHVDVRDADDAMQGVSATQEQVMNKSAPSQQSIPFMNAFTRNGENPVSPIETVMDISVERLPRNSRVTPDPIEPADGLLSPMATLHTPGRSKRMKDRHGNATDSPTKSPANGSAMSTLQSGSAEAMPPPTLPIINPPTRRGRSTCLPAEKAAREKAKADAKAEEKARKATEKLEKEAAKRAEWEEKMRTRAAEGNKKAMSQPNPHANKVTTPKNGLIVHAPRSLDRWATIGNSSRSQDHGATFSTLLDELVSSPARNSNVDHDEPGADSLPPLPATPAHDNSFQSGDVDMEQTPLFIAGSSQTRFPYSQWPDVSLPQKTTEVDTESESEEEKTKRPTSKPQIMSSAAAPNSKFRRLTDIAKLDFMPQNIAPPQSTSTPMAKNKKDEIVPDSEDDDDDDDGDEEEESSESDSDAPRKSHIPKSRQAGANLKTAKPKGLFSSA